MLFPTESRHAPLSWWTDCHRLKILIFSRPAVELIVVALVPVAGLKQYRILFRAILGAFIVVVSLRQLKAWFPLSEKPSVADAID